MLTLHAEALDAQARALRLRRAVLRAAAAHDGSAEYLVRAQRVTALSAAERRAAVEGFLDRVAEDVPFDRDWWAGFRAAAVPELPDDPTAEQIDAWVELAELAGDADFVASVRAGAQEFWTEVAGRYDEAAYRSASSAATEAAVTALREGVAPTDPAARPAVDAFAELHARILDRPDGPDFRRELAAGFERRHDPRAERYWVLVGIVNGWPASPPVADAYRWLIAGLRSG